MKTLFQFKHYITLIDFISKNKINKMTIHHNSGSYCLFKITISPTAMPFYSL